MSWIDCPATPSGRHIFSLLAIAAMNLANYRPMTRHCHQCGTPWTFRELPGRSEFCPKCRADLRVCLNCLFHESSAANQCRERRAEPVVDKDKGNFCEFFDFKTRVWQGEASKSREEEARAKLKALFGD